MTQPDDATVLESHDSSDPGEPRSELRPRSLVPGAAECSSDDAVSCSQVPAAESSEAVAPIEAQTARENLAHDSQDSSEARASQAQVAAAATPQAPASDELDEQRDAKPAERDRFTLIGLAPVDPDAACEPLSAVPMYAPSAASAPARDLQEELDGEEELEQLHESQALESDEELEEDAPTPDADGWAESEWLDLSTKWVIAAGPQPDEMADEMEVTNDLRWAERLSAGIGGRAETRGWAPQPPMAAQPVLRRVQVAESRFAQAARVPVTPSAFESGIARKAPSRRRHGRHGGHGRHGHHDTLAGYSTLNQDAPAAVDAVADAAAPSEARPPWDGEEPSYSDSQRTLERHASGESQRLQGPSTWGSRSHVAGVGTVPPWAAMPAYQPPPSAAGTHAPYSTAPWFAPHMPPPPWAAMPDYGHAPERRPSTRTDYAAPRRGGDPRAPQRHTRNPNEVLSLEQLKNIADSWLGAVGKLAIAAFALHYSGLAVPLLAQFGYAPALSASTPSSAQHASTSDAATLAAASVMGERPAAHADASSRHYESEPLSAAPPAAASPWRRAPKHELNGAVETASSGRRRSVKQAHARRHQATRRATDQEREEQESEAALEPEAQVAAADPVAPLTAAVADAEEALLRINSRPWSQVFVDGTLVGTTPKIDLRVSAGAHRIRLVNTQLGLTKTLQVHAAAGETVALVEQFDP